MTDSSVTTNQHALKEIESIGDYEIQPVCTCGWRGLRQNRLSDDYVWTNAREDWEQHSRKERFP